MHFVFFLWLKLLVATACLIHLSGTDLKKVMFIIPVICFLLANLLCCAQLLVGPKWCFTSSSWVAREEVNACDASGVNPGIFLCTLCISDCLQVIVVKNLHKKPSMASAKAVESLS